MFSRSGLLIIILCLSSACYSQKQWKFDGDDSIMIKVFHDSAAPKKYKLKTKSLKDSLSRQEEEHFSSKRSLIDNLKKKITTDSLKDLIGDSVNQVLKQDSIEITIRLPQIDRNVPNDLVNTAAIDSTPGGSNGLDTQTASADNIKVILYIAIGALLLGALSYYLFIRRKKKKQPPVENPSGDTEILVTLPPSLFKLFPNAPKDTDSAVGFIKEELQNKDKKLKELNSHLQSSRFEATNLEGQIAGLKITISEKDKSIQNLQNSVTELKQELQTIAEDDKDFKRLAEEIIGKYFTKLISKLRENENASVEEINRLILKNIFPLAFHSVSILKKYVRDATAMDTLNTKLLDGKEALPNETITDTSPLTTSSPLPYRVYQLLKSHGIKKLDDVFILGNKIGE